MMVTTQMIHPKNECTCAIIKFLNDLFLPWVQCVVHRRRYASEDMIGYFGNGGPSDKGGGQ